MTRVGVVLATGQSLLPDPQAVADRVHELPVVVVNDAFRLAPWARALIACDPNWWQRNPEARAFSGEKWTAGSVSGIPRIRAPGIFTNTNSGLIGLDYWVRNGAKRILLLGIDMRGTHYFGRHKSGLSNTDPSRFEFFIAQFAVYAKQIPRGVTVVNCSPESALDLFPKMTLDEALADACAAEAA